MATQTPAEKHDGSFGKPIGWRLWKPNEKYGAGKPVFRNPEEVFEAANLYFQWAYENPLYEAKTSSYEGDVSLVRVPKLRVLTIIGLCNYCGIHTGTWRRIKLDREDIVDAMLLVEAYIYQHKFESAAVGLLNPVFIGRAIGLKDKTEITGPGGGPIQQITSEMSDREAAEAYALTLENSSSSEEIGNNPEEPS